MPFLPRRASVWIITDSRDQDRRRLLGAEAMRSCAACWTTLTQREEYSQPCTVLPARGTADRMHARVSAHHQDAP